MAEIKSIIDIVVNDEKFKAFQASFNKYQEQLKGQGTAWDKSNKAMKTADAQFKSIAELSALLAMNLQKSVQNQDGLRKGSDKTNLSMQKLARTTGDVAKNIYGATTALLKWSGIATAIGGLLGAGGLFGIDRLAASVAGKGRNAAGLGTSIGQNSAFNLDFSRYVDPQSMLQSVMGAASSYEGRGNLLKLGIRDYNKNPADLAIDVMRSLRDMWKRLPANQRTSEYLSAFGGDKFVDMQEWRRLGTARDFETMVKQYRADVPLLNQSSANAGRYQNLQTQFERTGLSIEKTFADSLVGLAGPLEKLSKAVERAFAAFMRSDLVRDGIEALGQGIKGLADYLISPDFKIGMADFLDTLEQLGKGFKKLLGMIPGVSMGIGERGRSARLGAIEKQFGLPSGELGKISGLAVPAGWSGTQEDFLNNAAMIANFMKRGGSQSAIRSFVEKMIVGPDRVGALHSTGYGSFSAQEKASINAAVNRVITEIRVFAPAGSSVNATTNAMGAQ